MALSEVFNIDCMEGMKQYPDKYFDLAIVDPPYGIGAANYTRGGTQYGKSAAKSKDYGLKAWDNKGPDVEYFHALSRVSKNQIIWGANHFGNLAPASCWIVWDKLTGENGYADCELAWTSFDTAVRKFTFRWQGMLQGNMAEKEERVHPTQKPAALYKWLLKNYAKPGDKILDTHLGSQSSRIAAYDMGFAFTGFEIDAEYFKAGCERFENFKAQLKLFDVGSDPAKSYPPQCDKGDINTANYQGDLLL